MLRTGRPRLTRQFIMLVLAGLAGFAMVRGAAAQSSAYHRDTSWALQLPDGMTLGDVTGGEAGADGNIYLLHRCSSDTCVGRTEPALLKFDRTGKFLKSWGAEMFVRPHGFHVDRAGFVWVTDYLTDGGKGQQVFKFSPEGALVMTLGTAGVAGEGPNTFNGPSDVAVASNGDIFVADGHGGDTNTRIVKFSKDGKFLHAWGKKGSAPGELDGLHSIAVDSQDRVFVASRGNNAIEIFDRDGNWVARWTQFGRPSGIYIDRSDNMYVSDSQSTEKNNPGKQRGIYIGSAKDGSVRAFIPASTEEGANMEGVGGDAQGNVYGSEVGLRTLRKYVR